MTNQQRNDDILEYTKQLVLNRPAYQVGDIVLMHDEISAHPLTVVGVKMDEHSFEYQYVLRSILYPSMNDFVIGPEYLRPLLRSKSEMQQLLRVVIS